MRRHRFIASMAIVCLLILSGLAVACTPQATPTDVAGADTSASPSATPSPTATPGPNPTPSSVQISHSEISSTSEAIQYLGLDKFPSIYAGGQIQPNGSVTVYLGPGDDTAFLNALHALLAASPAKASASTPTINITHVQHFTIMRVPHSIATLLAVQKPFLAAYPQLKAAGYVVSDSGPNPKAGTYDVAFSSAPTGIAAAAATTDVQQVVAKTAPKAVWSLIRVTSVHAQKNALYDNRGHDHTGQAPLPYTGGDLVKNPLVAFPGGFCTTGFTVIGNLGYPRATTDHHCGEVTGDPPDYTNGGWVLPAPSQDHNLTPTPDTTTPFDLGATSNHDPGNGYADMQFLRITGGDWTEYGPYVWVGSGTSQPQRLAVGNRYAAYPRKGDRLTMDGAFSRMVRQVPVYDAGPGVCYNGLCGPIELEGKSDNLVWPVA